MNIFLIGFMGSGKTTVGKKLAKRLRLQFIDLDKFITNKYQKTIPEIFASEGESSFRSKETGALQDLCNRTDAVIATGGGTPCFGSNMDIINTHGISVYIKLNSAALFNRLKNSKSERPLISHLNDEELLSFIENKLLERESFYNKAHIKVDGINLETDLLVKEIDKFLSLKD